MTTIGAPLGILAFVNVAALSSCALMPAGPAICYGGREAPKRAPDQPVGCHAVLGCAAHRKLRTGH